MIPKQGELHRGSVALVYIRLRFTLPSINLTRISSRSESYAFEYDLKGNKAEKGSTVSLSVKLIGGTTFKIIGMMLCNR